MSDSKTAPLTPAASLRRFRWGLGATGLLLGAAAWTLLAPQRPPTPEPSPVAVPAAPQQEEPAPTVPAPDMAASAPAARPATPWATALRSLRQQSPAQLVHRAAASRQPQDFFAAWVQLRRCTDQGVPQAMLDYAAPHASESMRKAIRQLEETCQARGDRRQLAYVAQSWPADSPERRAYEAQQRQDHAGMVNYVLSTGSADFAAELLPGHITLELLEARGLLPPLKPEAADLEGMGPLFDLASVSRLRDQVALSRVVALWSCSRLGSCVEEAQLAYQCHALDLCVDDLRHFPEQKVFNRSPVDPNGSPSFAWVSRARWAQIQQAVIQLLGGLR